MVQTYQTVDYEQAKAALTNPVSRPDEVSVEMVTIILERLTRIERNLDELRHLMQNHEHARLVTPQREMESREV